MYESVRAQRTAKQVMCVIPRQEGLPGPAPCVHPLRTRLTPIHDPQNVASEPLRS